MANGKMRTNPGFGGGVYGLAFIGALVYYLQHATTFGMGNSSLSLVNFLIKV